MPRRRMLDPDFWVDEKIAQCSFMERLLFEGMWTFAEDNGNGRANPALLKSNIFPYDVLNVKEIISGLDKLQSLGMVLLYEVNGQHYYHILNFLKRQTINRPSPCLLPPPSEDVINEFLSQYNDSRITHASLMHDSLKNHAQVKLSKVKLSKDNININEVDGEKPATPAFDDMFDLFWEAYPRKVGKAAAVKKFKSMRVDKKTLDKILSALQWQKPVWSEKDIDYTPHPSTYLNQRRWEDEPNGYRGPPRGDPAGDGAFKI